MHGSFRRVCHHFRVNLRAGFFEALSFRAREMLELRVSYITCFAHVTFDVFCARRDIGRTHIWEVCDVHVVLEFSEFFPARTRRTCRYVFRSAATCWACAQISSLLNFLRSRLFFNKYLPSNNFYLEKRQRFSILSLYYSKS